MKNWIKKIGQNKFQFFFFLGLVGLLVVAIVLSNTLTNDTPLVDEGPGEVLPDPPSGTDVEPEEVVILPLKSDLDYHVVRKFYEKDATKEEQAQALIKYQNSYRTSMGTSYALKNGDKFDVLASISGKVTEISSSPLFGNYLVITCGEEIKTYYYGLSEISVSKGSDVKQGDKLGIAGSSAVDAETGNHVYFQIQKGGTYINPEKTIGKEVSSIGKVD